MRQITPVLSGAPGDCIDQLPMYHLLPVLLIRPTLLPLLDLYHPGNYTMMVNRC